MTGFWEDLWARQAEFLDSGRRNLRHGLSAVGVATLAGQYYCEYKVENEFRLGEIPTEAKDGGTALHDELIPTAPICKEGFAKLVTREEPSYAVLRVWGELGGIRLVGEPDHIVWSGGRPRWLVELKTTTGDPTPLWDDQRTQVLVYGALLERMGLDCSGLRLAVVRVKARGLYEEQKREWLVRISRALEEGTVAEFEARHNGAMKVHLLDHDVKAAEASVRRMGDYWLGEREARSSTSVAKCGACEYAEVCERSLVEPG